MDELRYHHEGDAYSVIAGSPYNWLATAEFGIDLLLGRDVRQSPRHIAYINSGDVNGWKEYLSRQGAVPKEHGPEIILIPVNNLDQLRNGHQHVVDVNELAEDAVNASPRHMQNLLPLFAVKHPSLHERVYELLNKPA